MLFFSSSEANPPWYSFKSQPVAKIHLDPVIGSHNKFAISAYPKIKQWIESRIKFDKFIYPYKRPIKMPLTSISVLNDMGEYDVLTDVTYQQMIDRSNNFKKGVALLFERSLRNN